MEVRRIEHMCMNCSAEFTIDESDCKDAMNCPACRGPIKITGVETITKYADDEPIKGPALLTIELQDETAVPKVFYEGEEITNKVMVSFDWETRTDELGGTAYNIDYVEVVNKEPIHKGVGLARGKYGVALFD